MYAPAISCNVHNLYYHYFPFYSICWEVSIIFFFIKHMKKKDQNNRDKSSILLLYYIAVKSVYRL